MLDLSHIPLNLRSNFSVFYRNSTTSSDGLITWNKPRGITYVYALCIGAGGGGASGPTGTNVSAAGGGGGASGTITTILIPAFLLPDILYPTVGTGGNAGVAGTSSYILLNPADTNSKICIANGGGAGSGTNGGTATTPTISNMYYGAFGLYNFTAGQSGSAGSSAAVGANLNPNVSIVSGGTAGGGVTSTTSFAGGNIVPSEIFFIPQVNGGTNSSNGNSGMAFSFPLRFTGGTGGAGVRIPGGGNGGNGEIGSGGGGGGGAYALGTAGGTGGKGGDGLIIICGL